MPCKIGWRGCRLVELLSPGMVGLHGAVAARISSRAEQEKKQSREPNQPIRHNCACRSAGLFATVDARQVLQPRDLVRRVEQVNPALSGLQIPGTALLVLPIDHSESVAESWQSPCYTPAQRASECMQQEMYNLTRATQSDDHDLFARFNGC